VYGIFLLQGTYAVLPQNGEAQLRIFNGFDCSGIVNVNGSATGEIEPLDFWKAPTLQKINKHETFHVSISNNSLCNFDLTTDEFVIVTEKQVTYSKYMMIT
jgi:hypothetical protein